MARRPHRLVVIDGTEYVLESVVRRSWDSSDPNSPVFGEIEVEDPDDGEQRTYMVFEDEEAAEELARANRRNTYLDGLDSPIKSVREGTASEIISLIGAEVLIRWALGQEAWGCKSLTEWVEDSDIDVAQEIGSYDGCEVEIEPQEEDFTQARWLLDESAWGMILDELDFTPTVAYRRE